METIRYFFREYLRQTLLVLACLVVANAMEGVGLTTLLPVLAILSPDSGADRDPSGLEAVVHGSMDRLGLDPSLAELLVFIAAVFWAKALVVLFAKRQIGYTVARVATDFRIHLLRALMAARWSHFTRLPSGRAANALATEADRASLAYHHFSQVAGYALEGVLYASLALAVSWKVTVAALVTVSLSVVALQTLVRTSGRAGRKQTRSLKSLITRVTDTLQAAKLLKATAREELIGPLLEHDSERLNNALRKRVFSKEALRALQEPIQVSAGCLGIMVAILVLGLPFAETLLLTALFVRTIDSANKMQRKYQEMVSEASAMDSILALIDEATADLEATTGEIAPTLDQGIEIHDVRLRYDGAELLRDFSISIPSGEITAIVGESGTGKTTLSDLVLGLVRPDGGEVEVDGVSLGDLDLRAWRRMAGYVPQEMLMLHDTIGRNVSLGDPAVTARQIEQALVDAGAWDFVAALPDGIDASVGERGALLSGGQRQRIAIARALVHGAKLLILDEATAALDPESEAAVLSTVAKLRGRATVLAISHQPALTRIADRVYRIEGGHAVLVESGRHADAALAAG